VNSTATTSFSRRALLPGVKILILNYMTATFLHTSSPIMGLKAFLYQDTLQIYFALNSFVSRPAHSSCLSRRLPTSINVYRPYNKKKKDRATETEWLQETWIRCFTFLPFIIIDSRHKGNVHLTLLCGFTWSSQYKKPLPIN
jgi:hypothetical protein